MPGQHRGGQERRHHVQQTSEARHRPIAVGAFAAVILPILRTAIGEKLRRRQLMVIARHHRRSTAHQ